MGGVGVAGLYKDLVLPISGAFGVSAEGYVGGIGSAPGASGGWDGGARLFATSRLLFLNVGVDWNARTEKADFILAFTPYFRRGGLFGTGGNFRIEWIPGRNHSFNFGFQIPLEPHMGKTRPRHRDAHPAKPPSGAAAVGDAHGRDPRASRDAPRLRRAGSSCTPTSSTTTTTRATSRRWRSSGPTSRRRRASSGRRTPSTPRGARTPSSPGTTTRPSTPPSRARSGPSRAARWRTGRPRSCSTRCCCRTTGSSGDSRSPTRSPASRRRAGSPSAGPSRPRRASIPRAGRRRSACSTRSRGCSSGPARS